VPNNHVKWISSKAIEGETKKLTPVLVTKQKGCMCTNGVEEHLNERHQRGPKPKTKGVIDEPRAGLFGRA
jgi:hypothetical protein